MKSFSSLNNLLGETFERSRALKDKMKKNLSHAQHRVSVLSKSLKYLSINLKFFFKDEILIISKFSQNIQSQAKNSLYDQSHQDKQVHQEQAPEQITEFQNHYPQVYLHLMGCLFMI